MYKLLIADDEFEIRNGLASYFPWSDIGFEVIYTCENGKAALAYILANSVDVVISDIKMPIMGGIDLAREINEKHIKTKVIFLSGFADFEYAQKALKYGVKNYIVKPTKYAEIVEIFTQIKVELDKEAAKHVIANTDVLKEPSDSQIISAVKTYVKENYRTSTLEIIAKEVYLNPFYLSKLFKQKTGINFSDYVTEVKMNVALELLKDLKYKTYEVSELVGYSNSNNFTRAFKLHFRMSPSEYRNNSLRKV